MTELYPAQRTADRILQLSCPTIDSETRANVAYLVSCRQRTIDAAIEYLTALEESNAAKASAEAASTSNGNSSSDTSHPSSSTKKEEGRPSAPNARALPAEKQTTPAARRPEAAAAATAAKQTAPASTETPPVASASTTAPALSGGAQSSGEAAPEGKAKTPVRPRQPAPKTATVRAPAVAPTVKAPAAAPTVKAPAVAPTVKAPAAAPTVKAPAAAPTVKDSPAKADPPTTLKHYSYGDSAANYDAEVLATPGQVILFTTSMTGDRQVRDRCRQLETLLSVKRIPYHHMDVADNALLKKKAREIHRSATGITKMPLMPLLCVDNRLVGNCETVQDLEDSGALDHTLRKLGVPEEYLHRAKPDYFDPSKKADNLAIMTPTTTQAGAMALPAGARNAGAEGGSATTTTKARAAEEEGEEGEDENEEKPLGPAAAAAAVAAAEAKKRVEELEAAKEARALAAKRAADEALQKAEKAKQKEQDERKCSSVAPTRVPAATFSSMLPPMATPAAANNGGRYVPSSSRRASCVEGVNGGDSPSPSNSEDQRLLHTARRNSTPCHSTSIAEVNRPSLDAKGKSPAYTRETRERYRQVPTWRHTLFGESNFIEVQEQFLDEHAETVAGSVAQKPTNGLADRGKPQSTSRGRGAARAPDPSSVSAIRREPGNGDSDKNASRNEEEGNAELLNTAGSTTAEDSQNGASIQVR